MTTWNVPGMPDEGRCLVMGVVNVTPDSFSDGGRWFDPATAVRHGLELVEQGADIVDVGGESTRPGAARVSLEEELARVEPVIRELSREGVTVSVDTMRAEVAQAAVAAGAKLVNDVSGGLADPAMPRVVAESGVTYVVMHWRGHSHAMNSRAVYGDVVTEVREEISKRVASVLAEGVSEDQIVLDPGLGFSKNPEHNWALIAGIGRLAELGYPLIIGASRKRFLGRLLADPDGTPRPFSRSDDATLAVTALVAEAGAWCVRVHNVGPNADAVRVAAAVQGARA
ncbi:dihydropteroate synthase [Streptosporangium sp. NBC_01756]|uniref:dihydropteroate synthase n=1 Tax=Streptosporangium sp. NBC_01756 TaxID=2975950 RepID=UPI002DD9D13D|nr:dihydropteroate synthase [Streptosporangium sp. NBC_01756]WSC90014.1 dihydropteroate synthase [Streptosporangium sp. NBC_01756]